MGTIYDAGPLILYVDNPGHGQLGIAITNDRHGRSPWLRLLRGDQLGALLRQVTDLALNSDTHRRGPSLLPHGFTPDQARRALPALQDAVLLAAAGADRHERVFLEPDGPPAEPLCVTCNYGTAYSDLRTASSWCDRHGHTAFGWSPGLPWADVQDRYRQRTLRWEREHPADLSSDAGPPR